MTTPSKPSVQQNSQPSHSMSLDEARKVMWLRNNYRPMGELVDEGYLDHSSLEWAAAKAYNSAIKQAAQVLLESHNQSLTSKKDDSPQNSIDPSLISPQLNITLKQARSTVWPFRPYQGMGMGILVERGQLSLKDLAYAIENAREERVRQAAIALTLVRLNQTVKEQNSRAGFLHIISAGRSYAERRQLLLMLIQGVIIGAFLGAGVILFVWSLSSKPTPEAQAQAQKVLASPSGSTVLLVAVVMLVMLFILIDVLPIWLLNKIQLRLDKRIQNYRRGQEGEDRVVTIISQVLDGNWYLFRNLQLPGRQRTDLDAVLVGPSGISVLEIKAYAREHRNVGEHWEYRSGNSWKPSRMSPSRQARQNAIRLANFLRADGIQQWIEPVVVWANPECSLTIENPAVPVWVLDRLPDELGNIWHGSSLSETARQQVVDKLTRLSQIQKDAVTTTAASSS